MSSWKKILNTGDDDDEDDDDYDYDDGDDDDDDDDDGGEGDFHLDENPVCSHTSLTSVSEFCPHQTFSKISSDCCPKCCQSLTKLVFQTFCYQNIQAQNNFDAHDHIMTTSQPFSLSS